MTAYWTCTKCKRVIEEWQYLIGTGGRAVGEASDTIDGARVCRACCAKEIEASKERKGDE